jgi:DNA-binding transcriptional MocR family regulator
MEGLSKPWEPAYARRAARMGASEIRELLKLLEQPDIISFAGGIPDPALFPRAAVAQVYSDVMADPKRANAALQYSTSEGYPPLRQWIAGYMTRLGATCDADNIVVTSGSQQALDFLARLFLSPGDTALVDWPTYLGALQAFNAYEPNHDRIDFGGSNRTPDSYTEAAQAAAPGGQVKFAYVVPDFANPTGRTLTAGEREGLLALARDLDVPVIEDGAYAALRYDGDPVPPVIALDAARTGHVDGTRTIYCGTFSKTLTPGLRIGWICAAKPIVRRLVLIKQASDLNSPMLNQVVMHNLATVFDRQVAASIACYRERRDRMLAALQRHMPAGVRWTHPEGGIFLWLTLPEGMDGKELLARAVEEERVAFVPGRAFFADGTGANTMRLSYSLASPEQIETGIAGLARLIRG